jgi:hypothetical protein
MMQYSFEYANYSNFRNLVANLKFVRSIINDNNLRS